MTERIDCEPASLLAPLRAGTGATRSADVLPRLVRELPPLVANPLADRPHLDQDFALANDLAPAGGAKCGEPLVSVGDEEPSSEAHHGNWREAVATAHGIP